MLRSMADEGGAPSKNPNCRVTWEGCSVLLDINDGDRLVFAGFSPSAFVKIGDKKCSLRPLVGCPFGSLFQAQGPPSDAHLQEKDGEQLKGDLKDNRALLGDNKAQSLSGEDIDAMRRGGASGDEIIEALISNSSTFEKKTVFSQAKYRLQKQKKYAPRVLLGRPFMRRVHFIKSILKLFHGKSTSFRIYLFHMNFGHEANVGHCITFFFNSGGGVFFTPDT